MTKTAPSTANGKRASTTTTPFPTTGDPAHLRAIGPRFLLVGLALVLAASLLPTTSHADDARLFEAVRSGKAFAIMRHALAPGYSDPAGFDVDDCSTQRNLSAEGRAQARAIGEKFRGGGIREADVYSSAWCRCLDTARLLGLGPVGRLAALNSFFEARERRDEQTRALRSFISARSSEAPLVLVTHQVNISALTGRFTRSGETIVATLGDDGKVEVLGSIE